MTHQPRRRSTHRLPGTEVRYGEPGPVSDPGSVNNAESFRYLLAVARTGDLISYADFFGIDMAYGPNVPVGRGFSRRGILQIPNDRPAEQEPLAVNYQAGLVEIINPQMLEPALRLHLRVRWSGLQSVQHTSQLTWTFNLGTARLLDAPLLPMWLRRWPFIGRQSTVNRIWATNRLGLNWIQEYQGYSPKPYELTGADKLQQQHHHRVIIAVRRLHPVPFELLTHGLVANVPRYAMHTLGVWAESTTGDDTSTHGTPGQD